MKTHKHQRHLINFLLQPFIQLRIGMATIALTFVGFSILSAYVYAKMSDFADVIVTLTESDESVRVLLRDYINSTGVVALSIVVVVLFLNTLLTIYFTHKMVGPTIAFRRHLRNLKLGFYDERVVLRKGDAFGEVAADLNDLAKTLEEKHGKSAAKSA